MNKHLLYKNEQKYKKLNIDKWHRAGITGKGVRIAVIGYGGCLPHKKPYLTNVNPNMGGSYHDGDAIIHDVAPDSKIFGLNMMDKNGWSMEQCLEWCINNDIDIICTSIRMIHFNSENKRLSKELYNKGVIMIDSSDNKGSEDIGYPAADPHWFAIGTYDGDGRAGYSSYGEHLDCLMYTDFGVEAQENYFVEISHTSGATQPVAGMAALLKEYMNITPKGFKQFMEDYCIDLQKEGWDKETGFGLLTLPSNPNTIDKNKYNSQKEIDEQEDKQIPQKQVIIMDTPAQIINNRFYIVARPFVEGLGGVATWDKNNPKNGVFELNGKKILLTDNSKSIVIDGDVKIMQDKSQIINDRFYVPARAFVEALGGVVKWDKSRPTYGIFQLDNKKIILKDGSREMVIETR